MITSHSRILKVQASGRCAELVVDTGHILSSGRSWLAYAKVPCSNVYTAKVLSESLGRRIGDAVVQAKQEAYRQGYQAGLRGEAPHAYFDPSL